jgi:hypothetical protein
VSYKSSSASDVSDAGWIKKKFIVTNLPHYSSNVAIRHNDATRRCDGDVTLRRDFALSCHNRQRWEELGNQQATLNVEAHVFMPKRESSHVTVERAVAASNPVADKEHVAERVMDKGKEKVDEKTKEPVFIGGVELVDLDDCDVPDRKLQCDSIDSDDDEGPNAGGIGVHDGPGSCSQTMEANVKSASMLVAPEVGEHFEPHTTTTAVVQDPLSNAAGKAQGCLCARPPAWTARLAHKTSMPT